MAVVFSSPRRTGALPDAAQRAEAAPTYRPLGSHLRETARLGDGQIEQILACQREQGLRFGQAALRLRLVTREQLQQALQRQFEFPLPADAGDAADRLAGELVMVHAAASAASERIRALRSQIIEQGGGLGAGPGGADAPRPALAVLSTQTGDGKSVLAANLAVSFSQIGWRTLLVDANLRRPRLHEMFGVEAGPGLASLLAGRPGPAGVAVEGLPMLNLVPAGGPPPNPLELIERPAFALLMQGWLEAFDQVIVDTPAAESGADARVLARRCGAALVVARPGRSTMAPLRRLLQGLQGGPTLVHGVVLNEG